MWSTGVDRYAAVGQLRDNGHREQGEAELWRSGDQREGASSPGPRDGLQGPGEA